MSTSSANDTDKANLGRVLFFDPRLSLRQTQSCATCHDPTHAFADKRPTVAKGAASLGDDGHSFGNRNAPTAAYARFSPPFHYDKELRQYVGGQFLDGRAATLAEQAGGPPLNPLEMAMPQKSDVVARLKAVDFYRDSFARLYGSNIWADPEAAYAAMTDAIAAFEQTDEFAPFDSKYDRYLRGEYEMTPLEDLGYTLFFSNNNVNCGTCHQLQQQDGHKRETFSNYQYHNIGVPKNPMLISFANLAKDYVDNGLLDNPHAHGDRSQRGKFKVPTLRNVAVTGPYMHNGVFHELRTVVLFYDKYNNADSAINPETGQPWAKAQVPETISLEELKAQKLTPRKVDALVAFMEMLTDARYEPLLAKQKAARAPKPLSPKSKP